MATEIKAADLLKKPGSKGDVEGFFDGVNKGVGGLVNVLGQMNNLMESYGKISDRLKKKDVQPVGGAIPQSVTPAIKPSRKEPVVEAEFKDVEKLVPESPDVPKPVDKLKRADELFGVMLALVEPYKGMLNSISAATALQLVMKPDNKKKVVEEIAKKL